MQASFIKKNNSHTNEIMSNDFIHSVKVPRLYKVSAKTVQKVKEDGASLKQLVYEKEHPNIRATYALAVTTLRYAAQLDELLQKTRLLFKEKRLDPWLARVLITELLWGKKVLKSESKPVQTVLSYETELRGLLNNLDKTTLPASKEVKKPRYVRVNTLVASIEDTIRSFTTDGEWILLPKSPDYSSYLIALSRLKGSWFIQDFHIPELLAFPSGTQFYDDPRYKNGTLILQDKASCFPAFLLKPEPGSTVLDMCAAPGMKTTHLAAIMQDKGKIFAIEKDKRRYQTLCKLVGESHSSCVTTLYEDSMKIDSARCPNVEYILVDPSCSGSGMSDRLNFDNASSKYSPERLKSLQSFQVFLLRHALYSFPMVKRVAYSTCSMFPEENEMVIDEILADMGGSYVLKSVKKMLHGNWKNLSSEDYACKNKCLYARPEIDHSNGFFVAIFERNFDVNLPKFTRGSALARLANGKNSNFTKETNPNEGHADEKRRGEKKRTSEKITKSAEIAMEIEPKRKKRSKATKSREIGSVVETDSSFIADESTVKKKRKNKKLGFEITDGNETIEVNENLPIDEQSVEKEKKKKKKKKKTKIDDDSSVEIIEIDVKLEKSPSIDGNLGKKKRSLSHPTKR